MNNDWWQLKINEQREQFALEINSLRNTLLDIQEHFNSISEYKKMFFKDDQVHHIFKTWEPYLREIFKVSDKYKRIIDAEKEKRNT